MDQDLPLPDRPKERAKRPPDSMPGLADASRRLEKEFKGSVSLPAIEEALSASYGSLAATATVHSYLSIFAERLARERLRQQAREAGPGVAWPGSGRPTTRSA